MCEGSYDNTFCSLVTKPDLKPSAVDEHIKSVESAVQVITILDLRLKHRNPEMISRSDAIFSVKLKIFGIFL